jgi:hypothetical protein
MGDPSFWLVLDCVYGDGGVFKDIIENNISIKMAII